MKEKWQRHQSWSVWGAENVSLYLIHCYSSFYQCQKQISLAYIYTHFCGGDHPEFPTKNQNVRKIHNKRKTKNCNKFRTTSIFHLFSIVQTQSPPRLSFDLLHFYNRNTILIKCFCWHRKLTKFNSTISIIFFWYFHLVCGENEAYDVAKDCNFNFQKKTNVQ